MHVMIQGNYKESEKTGSVKECLPKKKKKIMYIKQKQIGTLQDKYLCGSPISFNMLRESTAVMHACILFLPLPTFAASRTLY